MTDSLGDAPAVARQRVRRALRRARESTDFTQKDVADRLGWSLSKVQRIEGAEVAVSETDLRAMLSLLGLTDVEKIDKLITDARLARRERWWTTPEHRQNLAPGLRQLMQFESVATEIRCYQPFLIPGILQTPAMAEHIINDFGRAATAEARLVKFDARLLRRKQIIERPDGPKYHLILDESVLERKTGGARIMAEQLEDLAEITTHPNLHVRVVPYELGGVINTLGSFMLMTLSEDDDDDYVLYTEQFQQDSIEHDPDKVRPYRAAFEEVWAKSLPEDATNRLIRAKALTLRAELDRL